MRRHTPKKKFEWKKSEKKVSVRNQYTMPTITFSDEQFQALKNLLDNMEHDEHRWVQENHEDCEGEADDTAEDILARLEENGAGTCNYAEMQRVWIAINKPVYLASKLLRLENQKDILFEFVSESDLPEIEKRFEEAEGSKPVRIEFMTREAWEAEFGSFYKQTLAHRTLDDLYADYVKSWNDPQAEDS